jgi:uncharacterized protein YccT (UPF0319 family)
LRLHRRRDGRRQRAGGSGPEQGQSNPEALTQLQNWYNKADAETRKAFQIWVIQQQ